MGKHVAIWTVSLLAAITVAFGDVNVPSGHGSDWSAEWILVRLDRPLEGPREDGTFRLDTGRPELDAAIVASGIHRIGFALPTSSISPRDPEAFARWGFDRTYRFSIPAGADIRAVIDRFAGLSSVVLAEPDPLGAMQVTIPTDTRFDDQWHLHNTGQTGGIPDSDVDAPEGWDVTTGEPVVIAIDDSGIDVDHEDLDGILWVNPDEIAGNGVDDDGNGYVDDVHGWNFGLDSGDVDDTHGHGTGVSAMAVAESNNGQGIAGVCWGCRIMSARRATDSHSSYADAAVWAADNGAAVINGSYGSASASGILASAAGYVADQGVIHTASSGNDSARAIGFPARFAETIAVGATGNGDKRSLFSNYGPRLDVVAPGQGVLSAAMGGGYAAVTGTSYAAPMVAGLAGLVLSVHPSAGIEEVRHLIRSGADDEVGYPEYDTPGFDEYHGWGRMNVDRTLRAARSATTLRVDGGSATTLSLATSNPLAASYDFARGDLAALREQGYGVDTGDLACIENDSFDPDTVGNEDLETPAPGQGFFYVSRFNSAAGSGSYGGSSRNRDRFVFSVQTPYWEAESDLEDTRFGSALFGAGDVNGDGYDDLLVGARMFDGDLANEGAAFVYHGSPTGLGAAADWTVEGNQATARFGRVAAAGDVNGDGYDDVVVGADFFDGGEVDEGAAFLYLGSASGLAPDPAWSAEGNQADARFGRKVRPAGDVDGDGYDDVLVGAFLYDGSGGSPDTRLDRGRAFLYRGTSSGLEATPAWEADIVQSGAQFGMGLARGGDVNGDGFDDVVVGAPLYDNGEVDEGVVHVYHGSAAGPSASPDAVLEMNVGDARFGTAASVVGDVDGDGYDDVVVGAPEFASGVDPVGKAYLFRGTSTGVSTTPSWSFEGEQIESRLGINVEAAGDVNGDGYADFLVGADEYDGRRTDEGRAYLFLGSPTGPSSSPDWTATGRAGNAILGWSLGGIGNIDGDADGRDEIAVGSAYYSGGETHEGRVQVFRWPLANVPPPVDCPEN